MHESIKLGSTVQKQSQNERKFSLNNKTCLFNASGSPYPIY